MIVEPSSSSERRSFLTRFHTGAAALAALALGRTAQAQTKTTAPARWEPTRHEKDDWLDQLPGKHRLLIDTTTAEGVGKALLWGSNFVRTNRTEYGLLDSDVALIIVVRHRSVTFGYSDAIWAKYGEAISKQIGFEDPKTHAAPKTNIYNAPDSGDGGGRGTFESLAKMGVQIAVCATATRGMSGSLARATGGEADAINTELSSNLVKNGRMVAAGVVVVSRAQERGYTLVTA